MLENKHSKYHPIASFHCYFKQLQWFTKKIIDASQWKHIELNWRFLCAIAVMQNTFSMSRTMKHLLISYSYFFWLPQRIIHSTCCQMFKKILKAQGIPLHTLDLQIWLLTRCSIHKFDDECKEMLKKS